MDYPTKSFYDFCIPLCNIEKCKNIIRECIELGYRTIAITQDYDHTKKDTNKKSSDIFPPPIDSDVFSEFSNKAKIIQRLSIIYSDVGISHIMINSNNIKKYDLIAGLPKTEAALNHCCTTFNGDIISFDPEDKLFVNRKSYQVAVKRGMYFEIKYSPFINNSNYRKDIIKFTHNYHSKGKSKNIVITSGAEDIFDLRGPYDVANLALLLGLSEEQGKSAISSNCRKLYLKAESRRLGKTVMFVRKLGPITFSSTESEEEQSEDESDMDDIRLDESEQPSKKKKLE